MPSRIVIGGRLAWGTLGARTDATAPRVVRVDKLDEDGVPVQPVARRAAPPPGAPWTDEHGVTYRVVEKLDPREGWVTALTVMRWYGVAHETVVEWLQRGLLDGALERGSPTKKYRVLDPAKVQRELARMKARKVVRKGGRR